MCSFRTVRGPTTHCLALRIPNNPTAFRMLLALHGVVPFVKMLLSLCFALADMDCEYNMLHPLCAGLCCARAGHLSFAMFFGLQYIWWHCGASMAKAMDSALYKWSIEGRTRALFT